MNNTKESANAFTCKRKRFNKNTMAHWYALMLQRLTIKRRTCMGSAIKRCSRNCGHTRTRAHSCLSRTCYDVWRMSAHTLEIPARWSTLLGGTLCWEYKLHSQHHSLTLTSLHYLHSSTLMQRGKKTAGSIVFITRLYGYNICSRMPAPTNQFCHHRCWKHRHPTEPTTQERKFCSRGNCNLSSFHPHPSPQLFPSQIFVAFASVSRSPIIRTIKRAWKFNCWS